MIMTFENGFPRFFSEIAPFSKQQTDEAAFGTELGIEKVIFIFVVKRSHSLKIPLTQLINIDHLAITEILLSSKTYSVNGPKCLS